MEKSLLVIGATGFVGKRFLKSIIPYATEKKIRLKATGRTPAKLKNLIAEFSSVDFDTLDTLDAARVIKTIKGCHTVINCAGPFDLYGENVVAACATHGVHYLDITGEAVFGRRMIEKYSAEATKSGALIVPFAGFDSVPSDICTLLAAKEFYDRYKCPVDAIDLVFTVKGGFNGGTIATALDTNRKISSRESTDRHFMTPGLEEFPQHDAFVARYIPELKKWAAPFFMESINSKVVYRSRFLLQDDNERFVKNFQYRESTSLPGGAITAWGMALALKLGPIFLKNEWLNGLARKTLPAPGSGPSEQAMETGFFKIDVIARGSGGKILRKKMTCQGDPGNKSTVKILIACAKALLENRHTKSCGLLTPAAAFGDKLLPYLKNEGVAWTDAEKEKTGQVLTVDSSRI